MSKSSIVRSILKAGIFGKPSRDRRPSAFSSSAIVLSPMSFIFLGLDLANGTLSFFRLLCGFCTLVFTLLIGVFWNKNVKFGKICALGDALACIGAAGPYLFNDPAASLTVITAVILLVNAVLHYDTVGEAGRNRFSGGRQYHDRELEHIAGAVWGFVGLFLVTWFVCGLDNDLGVSLCAFGGLFCQAVFYRWSILEVRSMIPRICILACFIALCLSLIPSGTWLTIIAISFTIFVDLFYVNSYGNVTVREEFSVDFFLNRPARILIFTFVILCTIGSVLLYLPFAGTGKEISFIDAAFMAVSSSCVTGLTVLDVDSDFSHYGKAVILVLIQLGGLGVMSTASLAMQAMGQRLSLRHEKILADSIDADSSPDLMRSFYLIIAYIFVTEAIGAVVFILFFFIAEGYPFIVAFDKGLFLAVSAFCNAGMVPLPGNLEAYTHTPLVLYMVAALVLMGGMSPVTFLAIPMLLRRRHVSLSSYLALATGAIIITIGTVSYLALEWNGLFANLDLFDKINNAFFFAAASRTAGFNSMDVGGMGGLTSIVASVLMIIGGSPGGMAGGIKTAAVAIIFLVFWSEVFQKREVVCHRRTVPAEAVRRAVTIVVAFGLILTITIAALLSTQNLPVKILIFEAFSALGTVGWSLGATSQLNEIGKIIVMLAMFCGRIGPITIFSTMTAYKPVQREVHYPQERISLT